MSSVSPPAFDLANTLELTLMKLHVCRQRQTEKRKRLAKGVAKGCEATAFLSTRALEC